MFRTALVTGASSGIGAALARRLAAVGAEVALVARREDRLVALRDELVAAGGRARIYPADVAVPEAAVAAVRRADDELGGLDLVVANAGVGRSRWAGKLAWEDLAPTLAVNVAGAAATLVAVLPRMVERRRGHLAGVSSLAGYRGMPRSAAYSASKAFLSTFLESLRVDLRGTGVAVTDIRPGFVRTPMTAENRFPMPFLVDAGPAARTIVAALARQAPVVAFPRAMAALTGSARLLPNGLWDRVAARARAGEGAAAAGAPGAGGPPA
jgi:short-subunit dehydrogenase